MVKRNYQEPTTAVTLRIYKNKNSLYKKVNNYEPGGNLLVLIGKKYLRQAEAFFTTSLIVGLLKASIVL